MIHLIPMLAVFWSSAVTTAAPAQPVSAPTNKLSANELKAQLEQAGDDPVKLLEVSTMAQPADAKLIRTNVHKLLRSRQHDLSGKQLRTLATQIAKVLRTGPFTPDNIAEILGTKRTISRQLLYRRYHEQHRYTEPLPVLVILDFQKGKAPIVRTVRVWSK